MERRTPSQASVAVHPPSRLHLPHNHRRDFSNHATVFLGCAPPGRPAIPARQATSPSQTVGNGSSSSSPLLVLNGGASPRRQTSPRVSLDQCHTRPRVQNEYVGGPTRLAGVSHESSQQQRTAQQPQDEPHLHPHLIPKSVSLPPKSQKNLLSPSATTTIQPTNKPLKQFAGNEKSAPNDGKTLHGASESILCHRCGRCKCSQCTEPRDLPSAWICKRRVLVSADSVVECCTGLLCVRSVFYHCGRDCITDPDDDNSCGDDPCACCSRPHAFKRWLCMALTSLCLPCLCLYWPARGCVALCTACYNRTSRRGCRCSHRERTGRRALLEPDSSST